MAKRISVNELQEAVGKAVAGARIKPGPIIVGFVAPDQIAMEDAHDLATRVAKETGIEGTPTVAHAGSQGGHAEESSRLFPHYPIIIGLILKGL